MRSILVFADRDPEMASRLETGLSLARMSGGHISVIVGTPVARYMGLDAMGSSYLVADAVRSAVERDDAYAGELAEQLRRGDVPFDIVRCEGEAVDALCDAAYLADVIIVSRNTPFAGQLALKASAPVLLAPDGTGVTMPTKRACVAWDGGMAAAAAVRAAAPLLARSEEVHVLTIPEKKDSPDTRHDVSARDVLLYLSRHGAKAEWHELERSGSVEETLATAVTRLQGELMVMGAFGHSRLREYLFGGVTRYFLGNPIGPALLLAH